MKEKHYRLPLDFRAFFENGGSFAKCSKEVSIDQHIELLLTTCPGEHRFDPDYGCRIWEMDFENIASTETWEKQFKEYVYDSISLNEKRIGNIELEIHLRDIVKEERLSNAVTVRKRADINLQAQLLSTDEPIRFRYTLYLGPLSNE